MTLNRPPWTNRRAPDGSPWFLELILCAALPILVVGAPIAAVGWAAARLGRSTDLAASAVQQRELYEGLQRFLLVHRRYPAGLDSLHQDTTAGVLGSDGDGEPDGVLFSGGTTATDLWTRVEMVALSANQSRSLMRGGIELAIDHQTYDPLTGAGECDPNRSGKYPRRLSPSAAVVAALPTTRLQEDLVAQDFDYAPEPGTRVVVFGVGDRCALAVTNRSPAPCFPGAEDYYGRYVVFFRVFETGEPCELLGVADAYGRLLDQTQRELNASMSGGPRQS